MKFSSWRKEGGASTIWPARQLAFSGTSAVLHGGYFCIEHHTGSSLLKLNSIVPSSKSGEHPDEVNLGWRPLLILSFTEWNTMMGNRQGTLQRQLASVQKALASTSIQRAACNPGDPQIKGPISFQFLRGRSPTLDGILWRKPPEPNLTDLPASYWPFYCMWKNLVFSEMQDRFLPSASSFIAHNVGFT